MERAILQACMPWAAALVASVIAAYGLYRVGRRPARFSRLRELHSDQSGAVQSLSFVLTLPLFIMVMLFIVQVSQVMIGTVIVHYSAYAAARSAVVWIPAELEGASIRVCVHRKGATRAFGPGSPVLPDVYRDIGQPVLVPGSMGTASWVLLGTKGSMEQTFGSTCHGAGRTMSRSKAKKQIWGSDLRDELEAAGIHIRAGSMPGLAEEAPIAYKDVDRVVDVVDGAGIAKKVARIVPVAVVKG